MSSKSPFPELRLALEQVVVSHLSDNLQRLQLLSRPVDWKTLIDDRALRLWQAGATTKGQP